MRVGSELQQLPCPAWLLCAKQDRMLGALQILDLMLETILKR